MVSAIPGSSTTLYTGSGEPALATRTLIRRIGAACTALIVVPAWAWIDPVRVATLPAPDGVLPTKLAGWSGPSLSPSEWNPVFKGSDLVARGAYLAQGSRVDMYVAAYATQAQDKELIGYGNSVVGSDREVVVARSRIDAMGPAVELIVERGRHRAVIWYTYQVGELRTNRDVVAQVSYGLRTLFDRTLTKIIAVRSECSTDCDAARAALRGLSGAVISQSSVTQVRS